MSYTACTCSSHVSEGRGKPINSVNLPRRFAEDPLGAMSFQFGRPRSTWLKEYHWRSDFWHGAAWGKRFSTEPIILELVVIHSVVRDADMWLYSTSTVSGLHSARLRRCTKEIYSRSPDDRSNATESVDSEGLCVKTFCLRRKTTISY